MKRKEEPLEDSLKKYNNKPRKKNEPGARYKYSKAFMRRVVMDYRTSDLSGGEIARKYGLNSHVHVFRWQKLFPDDIALASDNIKKMSKSDPAKKGDKEGEDKAKLLKQLEMAQLQVAALESMIDIAENELGIQIRKKSGTKQ